MKTLLAAALALGARSQDETSLMQGLARRVEGKLGVPSADTRGDTTAKLMETATKMLKSGVTPDVITFIETTITDIETEVLTAIQTEHEQDQADIYRLLALYAEAVAHLNNARPDIASTHAERLSASDTHKMCRSEEALYCAGSRRCEYQLEEAWKHVKVKEEELRRIHDRIHDQYCVIGIEECDPFPSWQWNAAVQYEGPETSQSVDSYPERCKGDGVFEFRESSVTYFHQYIEYKLRVEEAWSIYNLKIVECAGLEQTLDLQVEVCDNAQIALHDFSCSHADSNWEARREFGRAFHHADLTYRMEAGQCRINLDAHKAAGVEPHGAECDIHAHPAIENCNCDGIRQKEVDRMREYETLHIVKCLLETVYTHVTHSIDSGEPCPTTESHPDQTEGEILFCHVVEANLTDHLRIVYGPIPCDGDAIVDGHRLRSNILQPTADQLTVTEDLFATIPHPFATEFLASGVSMSQLFTDSELCILPPVETHACSSEYVWEEQGSFSVALQALHTTKLAEDAGLGDYFSGLSPLGWPGCAAPRVCVPCMGIVEPVPDVDLECSEATPLGCAVSCHQHELYLSPGENNQETFRCLTDVLVHGSYEPMCLPASARCNGFQNCADGSDERHCWDTPWGHNAVLSMASTEQCRDDAAEAGQTTDVQFTCVNGQCTDIEARCNGFENCADGSDEEGCPSGTDGLTVEPTSGLPHTLETAAVDSEVFHDRQYTFDSLGSFTTGAKFVRVSNEDKHTDREHVQLKLRLPQPLMVYVVKLTNHDLPWLQRGDWQVSNLEGVRYSAVRMDLRPWHESEWTMTRHAEWIMGAPSHLDGSVHRDWAHQRHTEELDDRFLAGNAAHLREHPVTGQAGDILEDHYGPGVVYQKMFPAGVVSMPGNGGGDGTYLTFVANPTNLPVPPTPPTLPPMPAGEYSQFRLTITSNQGGASHMQLTELHFWNGNTAVELTGAVATSDAPACRSSEAEEHAVDGSTGSKWCVHPYDEPAVLNLQLSQAVVVNGMSYITGNDVPTRDPLRFQLAGSNGDDIWHVVVDHSCSDAEGAGSLGRRQETGVYTTESAGCAASGSSPWTLVVQYGATAYPANTGSIGAVSESELGSAKLSDASINALPSSDSSYNYYKLTSDSEDPAVRESIILRTAGEYDDIAADLGWGGWSMCLDSTTSVEDCTSWSTQSHSRLDTSQTHGNDCDRWFSGYNGVKCWAHPGTGASYDNRCFSHGNSCSLGAHAIRTNLKMYKYTL